MVEVLGMCENFSKCRCPVMQWPRIEQYLDCKSDTLTTLLGHKLKLTMSKCIPFVYGKLSQFGVAISTVVE